MGMRISHMTPSGTERFEHEIPQFGLGVFLMSEEGECRNSVLAALDAGYTHIDTARAYNNEHEVGEAIKQSGMDRSSIFITTKLRRMHATGFEEVVEHCQKSLKLLDTDYIDLYLVHAPPENPEHRSPVWKGMEYCLEQGWVKAIGVSNYGPSHLDAMKGYATYLPSVNQVEFNPWLQRPHLFKATEDVGAKVMAYSPLARGHKVDDPELVAIAEKLGCTPAQAAIKFCYDSGCITIPKSSKPDRIVENLASLEVDISSQMDAIKALECNYVSGWDPTTEP